MRVVVIGSGLIGVSSAYFLARAGAQVTVLDRESAPAQGTSHANSGMLTPSMAEPWNAPGIGWRLALDFGRGHAPLRVRRAGLGDLVAFGPAFLRHAAPRRFRDNAARNYALATYSLATLRELRDALKLDYDQRTAGSLRVFRSRRDLDAAAARFELLAACGLAPRALTPAEVVAVEPALAEIAPTLAGGIHCAEDESGDARRFTAALARAGEALGVRFRHGVAVSGFVREGSRVRSVRTGHGSEAADAVVVAAGAWSRSLLQTLRLALPLCPVKGYSITLDAGRWPLRPQHPVIDDTLHLAVTPLGERLRVAGLAEFAGFDRTPAAAGIDGLFAMLLAVYPSFAPHLDRARAQPWAGLRPVSADGVPFIGRMQYDNLYVNTGHGHLGWTLAAGSGRLLADLVQHKAPALDAGAYAPQRVL